GPISAPGRMARTGDRAARSGRSTEERGSHPTRSQDLERRPVKDRGNDMRAWRLPAGSDGFDKLALETLPDPTPGPGEVLIQVRACSINYRDFAVAAGKYFGGALKAPAIPLSDGAGQVVAVGPDVKRFKE